MVTPLSPESFHISITNTLMGRDPVLPDCAELPADSNAMKPAELEGSSVGDESSGYESGMSSSENQSVCNKKRGNKCTNKCTKDCCTGTGRRVKVVSSSEAETSENAETTESAGEETTEESHNSSVKAKKNKNKKKGRAAKAKSSTENESSAQTEEASSTDADTSAKSSKASNKVDPNWSISEDCRLRSMKEAGETWNFIASSLCKTKNDVRSRWKVLQSQTTTSESTTEIETGNATTEAETEGGTNPDENKTDDQEGEESKEEDEAEGEDEDEEEEASSKGKTKGKAKANNAKTETKTNSSVNNKWHKGTRNDKVATENKRAKARAKAKASEKSASSIASGEEASVESPNVESSESSSQFGYGDPEKQQETKYLQDQIYGELYPAEIHPEPDAYLGKRDCKLLATIDSKYKRSRWLEMQANFYNVTGRMVPLEAIRARCERAEAEKEERAASRKLESRINKVEKWIAKQSHEDSES